MQAASEETNPSLLQGLSDEEVAERVAAGKVNANADVKTKSVSQIVREHTLTFFNAVNAILALFVAFTGEYKNMLFMGVVFSNLAIGIFQEVRAKRLVDRLTIITASDATVIRGGEERHIPLHEVVEDDLVRVGRGDQVPADGIVVAGSASMNESLLTGESDAIPKIIDDEVLSGSFVDSGSLVFRATHVGVDSFASRINDEAKFVKSVTSEIKDTLDWIIRMATRLLVPIGLALFLRTYFSAPNLSDAILTTVAAVVGMIPQGLVLLTSSVLAIATARLGGKHVLVQQAYCVETLARVDVLCLDKTGTITTGLMEVAQIRPHGHHTHDEVAQAAVTIAAATQEDANETARAILAFGEKEHVEPLACTRGIPFSSVTKRSGCVCADGRAFVLGAAQFVLGPDGFLTHEREVRSFDRLQRVLVIAEVDGFDDDGNTMGTPRLVGLVGIQDQIRETAPQTMAFFKEQGVDLRVISGDDPMTVSAIAQSVGVPSANKWVDATFLESEEEVKMAVDMCKVFGRVTPTIKRELVRCLRSEGHTVAMTGDGVNDILALKEANCSVAMASGSAAARNVADIVLADSDFSHMPEVVAEGRRSINNLQRSASLFLMKTAYSAALALVCVIMPPFPLLPIQMSLVSTAIIGVPSFVLALEPNEELVKGRFLTNVLSRSMPASLAISVGLVAMLIAQRGLGGSFEEVSTACMLLTAAVGIMLIYRIASPLNPLRIALLIFCVAYVLLGCTLFTRIFGVVPLGWMKSLVCLVIIIGSVVLFDRLYQYSTGENQSYWDSLHVPGMDKTKGRN